MKWYLIINNIIIVIGAIIITNLFLEKKNASIIIKTETEADKAPKINGLTFSIVKAVVESDCKRNISAKHLINASIIIMIAILAVLSSFLNSVKKFIKSELFTTFSFKTKLKLCIFGD